MADPNQNLYKIISKISAPKLVDVLIKIQKKEIFKQDLEDSTNPEYGDAGIFRIDNARSASDQSGALNSSQTFKLLGSIDTLLFTRPDLKPFYPKDNSLLKVTLKKNLDDPNKIRNKQAFDETVAALLEIAKKASGQEKEDEEKKIELSSISELKNSLKKENPLKSFERIFPFVEELRNVPNEQKHVNFESKNYDFALCLNNVLNEYYDDFQKFLKNNQEIVKKITNLSASNDPKIKPVVKIINEIKNKPLPFFAPTVLRLTLESGGKTGIDQRDLDEFLEDFSPVVELLKKDFKPAPTPAGDENDAEDAGGDDQLTNETREIISLQDVALRIKQRIAEKDIDGIIKEHTKETTEEAEKIKKTQAIKDFFADIDKQIGIIFGSEYKNLEDLIHDQFKDGGEDGVNYNGLEKYFIYTYSYKENLDKYIEGLADSIVEYAGLGITPLPEKDNEETSPTSRQIIPPEIIADLEKIDARVDWENLSQKDISQMNLDKWLEMSLQERRNFVLKLNLFSDPFSELISMGNPNGEKSLYQINLENTLYSLATQTIRDQINLKEYLLDSKQLSDSELKILFELPSSFTEYEAFRKALLAYYQKNQKFLGLGKLIEEGKNSGKKLSNEDRELFENNYKEIRRYGKALGNPNLVREILTVPDSASYQEIADYENGVSREENKKTLQYFERRQAIIHDIWKQYSKKEQEIIQAAAEKEGRTVDQMAVYEQEKILADKAQESQDLKQKLLKPFDKDRVSLNKKRSKSRLRKSLNKATLGNITGTLANLAAPGLGSLIGLALKAIPEKYRKLGALAIPALILSWLGSGIVWFFTTWGGFFGGLIGGAFFGAPGFFIGSNLGGILQTASGFNGGPTDLFYALKNGLREIVGTISDGVSALANLGKNLVGSGGSWFSTLSTTVGRAIAGFLGVVFGGTVFVSMVQQSAFLTQLDEIGGLIDERYVTIEKTILNESDINFVNPERIVYSISITPKNNYSIVINSIFDEAHVRCNEDTRSNCPSGLPFSEEYEGFKNNLNLMAIGTTLEPGEKLELGTYSIDFDDNYRDTAITNTISLNFDVMEAGVLMAISENSKGFKNICFGNCPTIGDCWPVAGSITQEPYSPEYCADKPAFSHCGNISDEYLPDAYDIAAEIDTPIYAIEGGDVILLEAAEEGFGYHLVIQGNFGITYAHLSSFAVDLGDHIRKGQLIGFVGNTGNSTAAHLHFEVSRIRRDEYILKEAYAGTAPDVICGE